MDISLERILQEMDIQGKQQNELGAFLGFSTGNIVTDWKSGRVKSYTKYLHAIADFLDVSVEYLKGETEEKKKPSADNDEELTNEKRLIGALYDQVPKEKRSEAIKRIIEALSNL